MSNAQLQKTVIHRDEASTPAELVALNRRTLVLVIAIAAFAAAAWVAMLPRADADLPRTVSFAPQSAPAPAAASPFAPAQQAWAPVGDGTTQSARVDGVQTTIAAV